MKKTKSPRRRLHKASQKEFVEHVNRKNNKKAVARVKSIEDVSEIELKASHLVTMTLVLANVQNNYFAQAITTLNVVGKSHNHEMKQKVKAYIEELRKLKGMSAELASIVQSLHGPEEESFNREADYLEELIPLFLDRIGDNNRTDFVAQCILHQIYDNYTSKLHQFEEYGHKHLTRSGEEAERRRRGSGK